MPLILGRMQEYGIHPNALGLGAHARIQNTKQPLVMGQHTGIRNIEQPLVLGPSKPPLLEQHTQQPVTQL